MMRNSEDAVIAESERLYGYAKTSVGMKDGAEASAMAVKWFVKEIRELERETCRNRKIDA